MNLTPLFPIKSVRAMTLGVDVKLSRLNYHDIVSVLDQSHLRFHVALLYLFFFL